MAQAEHEGTTDAVRSRNRRLLQGAVRAGRQRYDQTLGLIAYHAPPRRDGGHVAQESLPYAVALAETGGDPQVVRRIVGATLQYQDRRPHSYSYGNWFWMHNWDQVRDPNAVSFLVPHYWHLLTNHAAILGADLVARIREALDLAVQGILGHRCQWAYSNIYLLNILCKLQIGQVLDQPRVRDLGYWDFEEWLSYTGRFGIPEYNSPTYTAVQIRALECMLEVPADAVFHAQVRKVLQLYYTDLFLHYHPASGQFAGTKSRQYDHVLHSGRGDVHTLLFRQTGSPEPADSLSNVDYALSAYAVDPGVLALVHDKTLPLWISMAAGNGQVSRRVWMTPDYALSTQSGGRYGASDVQLEILYGSGERAGSAHLRGDPPTFELFCEQDRNLVAAAVRWRFWPLPERDEQAPPVHVAPLPVAFGSDYVPPQHSEVVLLLTVAYRASRPRAWVADQAWDGTAIAVRSADPLVVQAGDVLLGYRGAGSAAGVLQWVQDRLTLCLTVRAPVAPPWVLAHPFMLVVETKTDAGSAETMRGRMESARLSARRKGVVLHVRASYEGRVLRADVPTRPRSLLRAGAHHLPQGRLVPAVQGPCSLSLWSEF